MRCSTVPLRSTGQLLSRAFVVLLRKSIPQNRNLKAAAELNVMCELEVLSYGEQLEYSCLVRS